MKKTFALAAALIGLNLAAGFAGGKEPMTMYKGSKEFEQVKALEGHWEGTTTEMAPDPSKPMKVTVDYKTTSAGSAVVETLFAGTPHEMVTIYSDEGGKLAVTHYCSMHNQPHMTLQSSTDSKISLAIPKADTSMDNEVCHMHALTLDVSKPNQLTQTWVSYDGKKPKAPSVFVFTKKS